MEANLFFQHHNMSYFPSTFAGLILSLPIWGQPQDQHCYDDSVYWEVLYTILNKHENDAQFVKVLLILKLRSLFAYVC